MIILRKLSLAAALRTEAADIANDNRRELVLDGAKEIERLVQSNRELADALNSAIRKQNQIQMRIIPLTVKEITELQPTRVAIVREYRTVVGGLEISGEYDSAAVDRAARKHFGEDCRVWGGEPDDGDECVHVTVYALL